MVYLSRLLLLVTTVATEAARWRKLPELMTDHIFHDEDRDKLVPVVHGDGVPYKVGADHRSTSPRLDHGLIARLIHSQHLLEELGIDVWTFLE